MNDIITKLMIAIPIITAASTLITGIINGILNITNSNTKHVISWIVPTITGILCVALGDIQLGHGAYDYLIGAFFGIVAGGASNGLYDWPAISSLVNNISATLSGNRSIHDTNNITE